MTIIQKGERMSDLISRQAALDAIRSIKAITGTSDDAILLIDKAEAQTELVMLPSAQPQSCKDAVSKADVLEVYAELYDVFDDNKEIKNELHKIYDKINTLQAAQPQQWIPVSDGLPDDLVEVNVTWINHNPEPYYDFIKDKAFTATAIHYRNKWYWYSSRCADILAEYMKNDFDEIDEGVEIIAWMPLPEPWKGE